MAPTRWLLLPLLAMLLAGCGSGGGAPAKPLSGPQAKLVAEADPICAAASEKRAKANAELHGATSFTNPEVLKTIARTAPGVSAAELQAVAKLRKLTVPPSLTRDWQTMLEGLQKLAKATSTLSLYAKQKNVAGAETLVGSTQAVRQELLTIAKRDGFQKCGRAD